MNFDEACHILHLTPSDFDNKRTKNIKKAYYKLALKHHPDHNLGNIESNKTFQKIGEAYKFLTTYIDIEAESRFDEIEEEQQKVSDIYINFIKKVIGVNVKNISLNVFEGLNKSTALKVATYLEQYQTLLELDEDFLSNVRFIIREKFTSANEIITIILNPTIENILDDDIYKLEHNEKTYYVPLWHEEIGFVTSSLIVKCIPNLPEHIQIDHNNDLHVRCSYSIQELFLKEILQISIGTKKVFEILVSELNIKKNQIYTLKNQGVSLIDTLDIYNVKNKGNVYFHITITE